MEKYVILLIILSVCMLIGAASVKKHSADSEEPIVCPEMPATCDVSTSIHHRLQTCVWDYNCKPNFICCKTSCSNKICVPALNPNNIIFETNKLDSDDDNVEVVFNQDQNKTNKNQSELSLHNTNTIEVNVESQKVPKMIVNIFHHIIKKYYIQNLNIYVGHDNNNVLTTEKFEDEVNINVIQTTSEEPDKEETNQQTDTEKIDDEMTDKSEETETEKYDKTKHNTDTSAEKPLEGITETEPTIENPERNQESPTDLCKNTDDEDCYNFGSGSGMSPEILGLDIPYTDDDSDNFSGSGDLILNDVVKVFDAKDSIIFKTSDGKLVIIGDEIPMNEISTSSDEQECDENCKNAIFEF